MSDKEKKAKMVLDHLESLKKFELSTLAKKLRIKNCSSLHVGKLRKYIVEKKLLTNFTNIFFQVNHGF